jgi:hypothetical protein
MTHQAIDVELGRPTTRLMWTHWSPDLLADCDYIDAIVDKVTRYQLRCLYDCGLTQISPFVSFCLLASGRLLSTLTSLNRMSYLCAEHMEP